MTANDRAVLGILCEHGRAGETFLSFQFIMDETQLDRKTVRRACRALTRKGLAQYQRGLWTEDGEPAGAGYGPTREGKTFMTKMEEDQ